MPKKYSRLNPFLNRIEIGLQRKKALKHIMAEHSISLEEAVNAAIDFFIEVDINDVNLKQKKNTKKRKKLK